MQYLLEELLIASITSGCIKEPVINVSVARALMNVRIPNSLNKSLFAAVEATFATSEAFALVPESTPPARGRTVKPLMRSLRFIVILLIIIYTA